MYIGAVALDVIHTRCGFVVRFRTAGLVDVSLNAAAPSNSK